MRFAWVAPAKMIKRMLRPATFVHESPLRWPATSLEVANAANVSTSRAGVRTVAVIGASSMVGSALLPMLVQSGNHVIGYSRKTQILPTDVQEGVEWREIALLTNGTTQAGIQDWIWLAPIKVLPQFLPLLQQAGARRVVAVSTTSRYTKLTSSSEAEREYVAELIAAEESLQQWGRNHGVSWTILRPTMIYGFGMDKNVCVIANFIHRFQFFTTLGKASGSRQPIHAKDVAAACHAALQKDAAVNHSYNISGAEILNYREMVNRIFHVLGKQPRFVQIPLWMFSVAVSIVRILPKFRSWSSAMAERMNQDMVFDHDEAARDLGFSPQGFKLEKEDLPPACR